MASIDQVIARARQGDVGFSERKQFKLARRRAIEKLRRFALADPYFYILELVQAAVAGGADYVDISCSGDDVLISWTGGALRADELGQLFDFLFASKERVDLAHVRSLALGVNALMLFEPEQVVIESGDGSPNGTTRMVVSGGADQVEVGTATGAFEGTYVRATKLRRDKVAKSTGRVGGENGSLEFATVESRCLAAPVPLVFNGQSLFGWARQRVPNLYGYKKVTSFDEGDLYGSVGLDPTGGDPGFALMTHGVWVQSYQYDLVKGQRVGGIICFDRLHKTVDHSGFVRDERFAEMWLRLRHYAESLVGGKASSEQARITSAEGLAYTPIELRELLREQPRVVIVAPDSESKQVERERGGRGRQIAQMLGAQLLRVPKAQVSAIRGLGGRDVLIWRPKLDDAEDQRFYSQPVLAPPSEPHLLPPIELEVPSLDALAEQVSRVHHGEAERARLDAELRKAGYTGAESREAELRERLVAPLRIMLGETGTIRATLYSPADPGDASRGLLVRVTATGRLLEEQLFASAYPGRILDVDLPTGQASELRSSEVWARIAEGFAALALPRLREQDQRALAGLGVGKIEPGSVAAQLALQVLSRVTVTRLRAARPGRLAPGLSFSLAGSTGFDPFSLPLLRTLGGRALSLRELALLTDETAGLVYGTVPEVTPDLDGLDLDRILALEAGTERALIGMLGEAGYVRVDARDVLTKHNGVCVRDVALGLRRDLEFPLPVEGEVGQLEGLDDAGRAELLAALLEGLRRRMLGQADEPGADPQELEEHRRQAVRHLQRYACQALARGELAQLEQLGLLDYPLFLDLDGEVWGLRQVHAALLSPEGLLVHYGHVLGSAELGALTDAAITGRVSPVGRPSSLAVSAFSYRLLVPLGRVRLAFDFDLDDLEAARNPMTASAAFLVRESFERSWGTGVLGIPATRLAEYRIQLRARGRGSVAALDELAHQYAVVGSFEVDDREWDASTLELIHAEIAEAAAALLERLIVELPSLADEPKRYAAGLRVLLNHAGEQLTLIAGPAGLAASVSTGLAERILSLPSFDTGKVTLVSGHHMIDRFRRHFEQHRGQARGIPGLDWSSVLAAGAAAHDQLHAWLDAHLQASRVVMPASSSAQPSAAAPAAVEHDRAVWPATEAMPYDVLAWNLEHWLAKLRPDPRLAGARTRVWLAFYELEDSVVTGATGLIEGGDTRVNLYNQHPLVQRVLLSPTPVNFAWLLFAVYAHLNWMSGVITNQHESQFQLILGDALACGRLQLLAATGGDRSGAVLMPAPL
ncbi:hypothetical protein DB30_07495 [Enhygromyxa salina]|uniref:Uncharacterized protein n=1 Tax=Enhygromyxa salina TaxID=215803 RepID=A0A0C2CW37_9BACT|nr:hypothetical protein [Enhygromyxa salina]KIG13840.1 hypothetical protein DB30_07495 [Enhygromyxa salina]